MAFEAAPSSPVPEQGAGEDELHRLWEQAVADEDWEAANLVSSEASLQPPAPPQADETAQAVE